MPTYEYLCRDCGKIIEVRASLAEKEKGLEQACPECGSKNMIQYFGNTIVIASTHLH
ncbi:MAG TPA: zinc ribbon domain-containing protein [Firmicutes bacterium]|nr:zinc ribbon domain-containing protein [Bacillota bacterium]